MTVHAKWWMLQYYEWKKKNQKLIYCFIKTLNILKLSIQILGKEHVRVTFHYLIQLFGEWFFFLTQLQIIQ